MEELLGEGRLEVVAGAIPDLVPARECSQIAGFAAPGPEAHPAVLTTGGITRGVEVPAEGASARDERAACILDRMVSSTTPISEHLRARKAAIARVYEALVRAELPELDRLDHASLIDHLPEFLEGLARWIDGETAAAHAGFTALAEGHAIQRLGYGVGLVTVTREYILMRSTILNELLAVPSSEGTAAQLVRVNAGMDEAVHEAVRRYTSRRDEARDRFMGVLAHDLRSPLHGIVLAAARIASATASSAPSIHRLAEVISRSSERMGRMLQDVIELARGQLGGGIPIVLREGDMGEVCREVIEELEQAYPGRELALERDGDLRGVWDHDRVIQTLSNLIGFALERGATVVVLGARESEDHQAVITTVQDTGAPVPPDQVAGAFEPFLVEPTRDPDRRGLGLGLYIARQICLAHGARCTLERSDASGTTLAIAWPRTPLDEAGPRT